MEPIKKGQQNNDYLMWKEGLSIRKRKKILNSEDLDFLWPL